MWNLQSVLGDRSTNYQSISNEFAMFSVKFIQCVTSPHTTCWVKKKQEKKIKTQLILIFKGSKLLFMYGLGIQSYNSQEIMPTADVTNVCDR